MDKILIAKTTIFDTPLVKSVLRFISVAYLNITGWKLTGVASARRKYVLIGAPHTSNWDFAMMLAVISFFRMKVYFFAKHTIFIQPFGTILHWVGGIPVDRRQANNLVERTVNLFAEHDDLIMLIPPEGTRKNVRYWKSGFYHIAAGSKVPIVLGYIDFKTRSAGFFGEFEPCGDYDTDIVKIQELYADIISRNRGGAVPSTISPPLAE